VIPGAWKGKMKQRGPGRTKSIKILSSHILEVPAEHPPPRTLRLMHASLRVGQTLHRLTE